MTHVAIFWWDNNGKFGLLIQPTHESTEFNDEFQLLVANAKCANAHSMAHVVMGYYSTGHSNEANRTTKILYMQILQQCFPPFNISMQRFLHQIISKLLSYFSWIALTTIENKEIRSLGWNEIFLRQARMSGETQQFM